MGAAAPVKLASGAEADFAAQCVDEEALFLASDFPIKPEDLIARSKEVLTLGLGTKDEGACLAEAFEFCAAVVGPIGKEEYLAALGDFKLEESFDVNAQYHMFRVDPTQTNRVWFHTRTLATHVADSKLFGKATGKEIVNPPQCMHMDFTADGLVKEVGFYTVDRRQGNTAASAAPLPSSTASAGRSPSRSASPTSPRSATASSRASSPRRTNELNSRLSRRSWHAYKIDSL